MLPGISERERDVLWHRCALRAERWLTDEGLQAVLNYFHQSTDPAVDGEEMCLGVWWDVVVGKATSTTAADTGGMDVVNGLAWTWSARWAHWHGWFKSMALAERAKARASEPGGTVVPMSAYGPTPRSCPTCHRFSDECAKCADPWHRGACPTNDEGHMVAHDCGEDQ